MLNLLFKRQIEFQKKVGLPYSKITSKKTRDREILSEKYILAMIDELIEFRNCYNKKDWTKTRFKINEDELKEELIDIWWFTINLAITWGMSANDVLSTLNKKQIKNFKRLQ